MKALIFFVVLLTGLNSFSQESASAPAANPAKAEIHKNKARILIDKKEWNAAGEEAREATKSNPKDADAWLILGTVAMRLEANAEALDAFNKYLALNPPAEKAAAVRTRVAELEVRLDKERKIQEEKDKAEAQAKADRFGPQGTGFFIGYSPSFKPSLSTDSDLNSTMSSSFDFGFRFKMWDVGLRHGSGTVARLTIKDDQNVFLRSETNGKHSLWEFFSNVTFPLSEPPLGKAGTQFLIPVHFGMYENTVGFTSKTYWNMGLDLGAGGQFRYYTGSNFVFDITGLYLLGLPVTSIQNNDTKVETAYNAQGAEVKGSLTGLELRAGVTFLF